MKASQAVWQGTDKTKCGIHISCFLSITTLHPLLQIIIKVSAAFPRPSPHYIPDPIIKLSSSPPHQYVVPISGDSTSNKSRSGIPAFINFPFSTSRGGGRTILSPHLPSLPKTKQDKLPSFFLALFPFTLPFNFSSSC